MSSKIGDLGSPDAWVSVSFDNKHLNITSTLQREVTRPIVGRESQSHNHPHTAQQT